MYLLFLFKRNFNQVVITAMVLLGATLCGSGWGSINRRMASLKFNTACLLEK